MFKIVGPHVGAILAVFLYELVLKMQPEIPDIDKNSTTKHQNKQFETYRRNEVFEGDQL